jgi:CheY-like chemotaxis protein
MTQALEQGSWDLVLSDIAMPQFTGADALELVPPR